jgi:hypothetical protein
MRLETWRDNKSGTISVRGTGFAVVISTDGRIKITGNARIEETGATHELCQDSRSPRSKETRRGSR